MFDQLSFDPGDGPVSGGLLFAGAENTDCLALALDRACADLDAAGGVGHAATIKAWSPHCCATALARPGNVALRIFQRSGPGLTLFWPLSGLVRPSWLSIDHSRGDQIGPYQFWQPLRPKAGRLAGIIPKPMRLHHLRPPEVARKNANRVFNGDVFNRSVPKADNELDGLLARCFPDFSGQRFRLYLLVVRAGAISPLSSARQLSACRMENAHVPAVVQHTSHVALDMAVGNVIGDTLLTR